MGYISSKTPGRFRSNAGMQLPHRAEPSIDVVPEVPTEELLSLLQTFDIDENPVSFLSYRLAQQADSPNGMGKGRVLSMKIDPLDAFLALHSRAPDILLQLSPRILIYLAHQAVDQSLPTLYWTIVETALHSHYPRPLLFVPATQPSGSTSSDSHQTRPSPLRSPDDRAHLFRELLKLSAGVARVSYDRILDLLHALSGASAHSGSIASSSATAPGHEMDALLATLPTAALARATEAIMAQPYHVPYLPFIESIYPILAGVAPEEELITTFHPNSLSSSSHVAPRLRRKNLSPSFPHDRRQRNPPTEREDITILKTDVLFQLIVYLFACHEDQLALRVFNRMVEAGRFPAEVVRAGSEDAVRVGAPAVHVVITAVLARTYLKRGAWSRSVSLVQSLLDARFPDVQAADSDADLEELQRQERDFVDLSAEVIESLVSSHTPRPLELSLRLLMHITSLTSSSAPFPQSTLRAFYKAAGEQRLSSYIEKLYLHLASLGSYTYDPPPPRTTLFLLHHYVVTTRNLAEARNLVRMVIDSGQELSVAHRSRFLTLAAQGGMASEVRALWERYRRGGSDFVLLAGSAGMIVKIVKLFGKLSNRLRERNLRDAGAIAEEEDARRVYEHGPESGKVAKAADELSTDGFALFARSVVRDFTTLKSPLESASHHDLSAIARCHFILHSHLSGMRILSILLERQEIPDSIDVNTLLTGLAEKDPVRAVKMLLRAKDNGLVVDSWGWNSVLHAVMNPKNEVDASVREHFAGMYHRAAEAKGVDFTDAAALDSSFRQILGIDNLDKESVRYAYELLTKAVEEKGFVPHASLGYVCINAALRFGLAEEGYEFWRMCMREKETEDVGASKSYWTLKRRLAVAIVRQFGDLELKEGRMEGRRMCYDLGCSDVWRRHIPRIAGSSFVTSEGQK